MMTNVVTGIVEAAWHLMGNSMRRDDQSITIQRAAEILGMSGEFLCKLIDGGAMPEHKIGDTRYLYVQDVLAYQEVRNKERAAALARISRAAAEAGLYDCNKFPQGGQDE